MSWHLLASGQRLWARLVLWRIAQLLTGLLASIGVAQTHAAASNLTPIKHVIIIMQENRSFDHYFGTFPGADGLPVDGQGHFTTCIVDPVTGNCVYPYHNTANVNRGGPHGTANGIVDVDGGKMDGFIVAAENRFGGCADPTVPTCTNDVMGYHDFNEIPNYWTYAEHFVLQDHMFEPVQSYSTVSHLAMVSGWSAKCRTTNPMSCKSFLGGVPYDKKTQLYGWPFAWTDLTWLLHKNKISWAYYIVEGNEPDCRNPDLLSCPPANQSATTPGFWNVLRGFTDVSTDNEMGNIQSIANFYASAACSGTGQFPTLPAVSWIVPAAGMGEHPPSSIADGQAYVTSLINAITRGRCWPSSAIFISWDDWGGFYDHYNPPFVDANGYGIRVPGLMISPYAKGAPTIDHQILSFDAYLKFVEDVFLNGQRLDPLTDKRADSRPDVRENLIPDNGDLMNEFDFTRTPLPGCLLPETPNGRQLCTPPS
jgi:phospholipase C